MVNGLVRFVGKQFPITFNGENYTGKVIKEILYERGSENSPREEYLLVTNDGRRIKITDSRITITGEGRLVLTQQRREVDG